MTPREELIWLAGLLEGEGYFGSRPPRSGYSRAQLRVTVKMTDRDVIERAAALMDAPGVRASGPPKDKPHWSPYFYCGCYGAKAAALMEAVRPYMGLRRGAEIDRLLALPDLSHT